MTMSRRRIDAFPTLKELFRLQSNCKYEIILILKNCCSNQTYYYTVSKRKKYSLNNQKVIELTRDADVKSNLFVKDMFAYKLCLPCLRANCKFVCVLI